MSLNLAIAHNIIKTKNIHSFQCWIGHMNEVGMSLTKEKLWESYGKPWAIYGPYMGMVWKGRVVVWS